MEGWNVLTESAQRSDFFQEPHIIVFLSQGNQRRDAIAYVRTSLFDKKVIL